MFRKIVCATTMLTAAGVVLIAPSRSYAQGKAKPLTVGISGSFLSAVSLSKQNSTFESSGNSTSRTGYDTFNVWNDSEIHFTGTTKLDNGISVSVHLELETDQVSNATSVDESYLKLTGSFGDMRTGSTKNVTSRLTNVAPAVGVIVPNDGDSGFVIVKPANNSAVADTIFGADDNVRIVYFSPRISGISVSASYQPSSSNNDFPAAVGGNGGTDVQQYNIAANYVGKFGTADITADISYIENHGPAATSNKGWRGGMVLGIGGISVGGSYRIIDPIDSGLAGTAASPEQKAYDVGLSFTRNSYAISATYLHGEAPLASATPGEDDVDMVSLGASYKVGAGVDLLGNLFYADWSDETTSPSNSNNGWALVGGINISF